MTVLLGLFATIALALPGVPAGALVFTPQDGEGWAGDAWDEAMPPAGSLLLVKPQPGQRAVDAAPGFNPLADDVWDQVRIEQRVIIRITPREPGRDALAPQVMPMQPVMQPMLAQPRNTSIRVRERKAGKCMPALGIAAVQPVTDGRLMFYMRDRRMLAAGLEKACSAKDFYLGFYMSKTADGQLCVGRDQIHSRAGTTCKLKDVREYVPVDGN
ncbi:hypothetical protein AQZ52_17160 [Novosphingobium fuchskuhlense]|uniref:Uncharacterized protein n=1 Tax=Novosphingobium fuchskuhlense TaxID=1117702 RepID=A0A117UTF9_9SPHN|nr:hypothetical protein [Novosphingobium fuchskuhlense]KUR70529.1 hypothetical protein AQZ52_17160 [Novosphingobium fuchskuhlense]